MLSIHKLIQPYLHYEFSPSKSLACVVIERPGLWMSEAQHNKLLADIRYVAMKNDPAQSLDYGILKGEQKYLENSIITIVYESSAKQPVAFNAMSYMPLDVSGIETNVIHLGLVMVDPDYRGKGFTWILYGFTCMLLFFRNLLSPIWISNVTQVPAVFGSVSESYDSVYPNPKRQTRCTFKHKSIARQILKQYRHVFGVGKDAEFDEQRFVIQNAYTGGSDGLKKSYEIASKHRIELYNEICKQELDYVRGDDFLQIGQMNLAVAKHYFLHNVPKKSLIFVLMQALFMLFSAVMLPIIRWFITSKQMGVLRPRSKK